MAIIDFQVELPIGDNATDQPAATEKLSGSGLGFFGLTAGSSVQIGSYQDTTFVCNDDGTNPTVQAHNVKYVDGPFPSGRCSINAAGAASYDVGLSGVKSAAATLGIRFGHNTAVKTQNVQLRIYDRNLPDRPASGVNTKVAEIVNFNGSNFRNQGTTSVSSSAVGSGDAFWWGEPWPDELVTSTKNFFQNSLGVKFYNGRQADGEAINGDVRLNQVPGDRESVGGSGIIVPLLDSPGSGQRGLAEITDPSATNPGMAWPKWSQYITTTSEISTWRGNTDLNGFANGDSNRGKNQGGTGYHTHHTWAVALSASPLNIGSKEQYGLYVSLEYL